MNKIEVISVIAFPFLSIICIIMLSMGCLDNSITNTLYSLCSLTP